MRAVVNNAGKKDSLFVYSQFAWTYKTLPYSLITARMTAVLMNRRLVLHVP